MHPHRLLWGLAGGALAFRPPPKSVGRDLREGVAVSARTCGGTNGLNLRQLGKTVAGTTPTAPPIPPPFHQPFPYHDRPSRRAANTSPRCPHNPRLNEAGGESEA